MPPVRDAQLGALAKGTELYINSTTARDVFVQYNNYNHARGLILNEKPQETVETPDECATLSSVIRWEGSVFGALFPD